MSRYINNDIERKLYAESMGRCMNPNCKKELFTINGDIVEKAHITPYSKNADNSFENLVILCPSCHTDFDKNSAFSEQEVLNWKKIRQQELHDFFYKKFDNFDELKIHVVPLLLENKTIYEKYYLSDNKKLWNMFENKILANNKQLRLLFEKNLNLFQKNSKKSFSNLEFIKNFILHTEEFEKTRNDDEKIREILFPREINSMFGIEPIDDFLLPSTESLEDLITKLHKESKYKGISLGINKPYIELVEDGKNTKLYLDDTPRLRQLYFNYRCFKPTPAKVRLESLNFALKYLNYHQIPYKLLAYNNLREISINNQKIIFVYEYCLSKVSLMQLASEEGSIIVNLHHWNGEFCISQEAFDIAKIMNITLLWMGDFYEYFKKINFK